MMANKKCLLILILSAAFVVLSAEAAFAEFSERVVMATGEGETKDEAVKMALRSAVEQGVGVLIDSETLIENNQLISDKVYSEVKGYIKGYDVLEEKEEDGLFEAKVKATVALARLRKDIKALNIILDEKENPRIAVAFKEYVDGAELPAPVLRPLFEKTFKENGFDVIDIAQLEKVKERDAVLSYDDPMKAAALGRRFGAEVLILGEASAELGSTTVAHGVKVYTYGCNVTVKAIKTDTASIMAVKSEESTERGGGTKGELAVARDALKSAGQKVADKMLDDIVEKWRSEVFNVTKIQLILTNAERDEQKAFVKGLSELSGVEKVTERTVVETTAIYDVLVLGAVRKGFDDKLLKMEGLPLKVVGKTANTIKVEVKHEE